jgi:cytosine/adenosine deaminase-related metal-dependent hydrolase
LNATWHENRRYIPIGFVQPEVLASNAIKIVANATLYHFGILTSSVHMAWVRAVCGRLEMRYRYSKDIVYNNFPWPEATDKQRAAVEALAQAVLDARAGYPESSLADLYDPLAMPRPLQAVHAALDREVAKLYGFKRDAAEADVVAALVEMYSRLAGTSG